MRATIYLNRADGHWNGYAPEHAPSLDRVTTLTLPNGYDDHAALELVFQIGNGADPESNSQYYVHEARSISVGDIIVLEGQFGHRAYSCDSFGWTPQACTPATCEVTHNAEVHDALASTCPRAVEAVL